MTFTDESPLQGPIWIIDDEEDACELMRRLLKRVGATEEIVWMNDGEHAVETMRALAAAAQPLPILVVLDLKMPGLDGFGVLRAIKAHPELARLFVVVVSSSSLPEDIARVLQLGAFCYFEKFPLPEKFAPVYQLARGRLRSQAPVRADACEAALRRIIDLVEEAIGVFHTPGALHTDADRTLMDVLGGIRRRATSQLLERVNDARAGEARWPFESVSSRTAQTN